MNISDDNTSAIHTVVPFPMITNTLPVDAFCVALLCNSNTIGVLSIKCTIVLLVEISKGVFIDVGEDIMEFNGLYPNGLKLGEDDNEGFLDSKTILMNTYIRKFILSTPQLEYNPMKGSLQPYSMDNYKMAQSLVEQIDDVSNLHLSLCSVCYVLTNVRPLGCHHQMCIKCILKLEVKKCPQCRKEFQYVCNNKLDLWNNHRPNFNWNDKNTRL